MSSFRIKKDRFTDTQKGILNGYRPSFEDFYCFTDQWAGYYTGALYKLAKTAELLPGLVVSYLGVVSRSGDTHGGDMDSRLENRLEREDTDEIAPVEPEAASF